MDDLKATLKKERDERKKAQQILSQTISQSASQTSFATFLEEENKKQEQENSKLKNRVLIAEVLAKEHGSLMFRTNSVLLEAQVCFAILLYFLLPLKYNKSRKLLYATCVCEHASCTHPMF